MLRRLLLCALMCCPAHAVKFFADVLPAGAAITTIAVNSNGIWHAIKATPRVVKAARKGPAAMKAAAKGVK